MSQPMTHTELCDALRDLRRENKIDAWNHRVTRGLDIYIISFLSNQPDVAEWTARRTERWLRDRDRVDAIISGGFVP